MNFPRVSSLAFLAPMAGITDVAFRDVASKCGAGLTTTELVSAKGILQNNSDSQKLIRRGDAEKNFAIQLFGSEPKSMALAAAQIESHADIIDINAGCPVPKVCKTGAGAALLTNLQLTGDIIDAIQKVTSVPLSVKMRIGINDASLAIPFAKLCEEKDISLLTVHGRTQRQGYSGKANWKVIQEVAGQVSIPVVGNGDIKNPQDAQEKLELKNVEYVAIGRGASGNPYLFTQINDLLSKNEFQAHSFQRQYELFEQYLELAQYYDTHFMHQLLQAQHFFKGVPNAAKFRLKINSARSPSELLSHIDALLKDES